MSEAGLDEQAPFVNDRVMVDRELCRAVDLLAAGDWQSAHEIVQQDGSRLASWLHGIVHTLEGDLDNAQYWYGQAGRDFRGREAVQDEISAARRVAFGDDEASSQPER